MDIDWARYIPEIKLLLIAAGIFVLLYVVARIATRVLARVARRLPYLSELIARSKPPLHLLVPLFGLQTVWASASNEFAFIHALRHITTLAIILGFTWLGLRVVKTIQYVVMLKNPMDMADNLNARRIQTQTRVLVQTLCVFVIIFGAAAMLMTFPGARQFGTSILASAGLAGLAVGFAARPVLGNLIAGLQIAITQPIRLDDVVIVENEWGRIEEITGTYVVVKIWDQRRLIVPLQWFIENPFQNWTRQTSTILGSVFFWVDYAIKLEPLRQELDRLLEQVPQLWDGQVKVLQVTDTSEKSIQLRVLASSIDSSKNWDLRCYLRENLIKFISANQPECLPLMRANITQEESPAASPAEPTKAPEHQPPV